MDCEAAHCEGYRGGDEFPSQYYTRHYSPPSHFCRHLCLYPLPQMTEFLESHFRFQIMSEDPTADVVAKVANFGLSEPLYLATVSTSEHDASIVAPGITCPPHNTTLNTCTHTHILQKWRGLSECLLRLWISFVMGSFFGNLFRRRHRLWNFACDSSREAN